MVKWRSAALAAALGLGLNAMDTTRSLAETPAPAPLGWTAAGLDRAFDYAKSLPTDSLVIVTDGVMVRAMGDLTRRYDVHSVRKALLSAVVASTWAQARGRSISMRRSPISVSLTSPVR